MEFARSKSVSVIGSGDKHSITVTFVVNLTGNFLPMQLICSGKTDRCIPNVVFPKRLSVSVSPKHYSNEEETKKNSFISS